MLRASGIVAIDAGNTEVPLVAAIDDPAPEVFVVEASSFRLAPLRRFRPTAAAWLNFAPDHLDVHLDLASYEAAKANLWARAEGDDLAVANADDPVVMAHAPAGARVETFGLASPADWHVDERRAPRSRWAWSCCAVADLPRALPARHRQRARRRRRPPVAGARRSTAPARALALVQRPPPPRDARWAKLRA